MRRNQGSEQRWSVLACVTAAGLAVHAPTTSACTGNDTCFGEEVLASSTGILNTGIGYFTLSSNKDGSYNTASGAFALYANTTGRFNVASGYFALGSNTTGYENTANGQRALGYNTTGYQNTAGGSDALYRNTSGKRNTAGGFRALWSNSTGDGNTATGSTALNSNTSGINNTAMGGAALFSNITGNYNTALGGGALRSGTTGFRNVALGYQAGYSVTTGSDNIIIGGGNQGTSADAGVIRIGASAYQKQAFIAGIRGVKTGATGAVAVLIDANGQLGTINSSRQFKEDIQPMGSVSEKLFGLRPVTFRYTQPFDDGSKPVQYGLIAEEVAEVFPELVVYGEDGKPETVSYHLLATLLLNEVQKEHRVSERLQGQVQAQAEQLAAMRQEIAVLAEVVGRVEKERLVASSK
jgi:hypothetical protein